MIPQNFKIIKTERRFFMPVLKSRKAGTPTIPMTIRIEKSAHEKLRLYALKTEQSMVLAIDELIHKGTESSSSAECSECKQHETEIH
jgi:hypothetical protein